MNGLTGQALSKWFNWPSAELLLALVSPILEVGRFGLIYDLQVKQGSQASFWSIEWLCLVHVTFIVKIAKVRSFCSLLQCVPDFSKLLHSR